MSSFRQRSTSGSLTLGSFIAIPHPVAVEVMAGAGPDFLCIDAEHAQISREKIENLIRASDVHGVPCIVRVPGHVPDSIQSVLDAGAAGVLVPRVNTADEARAMVQATRYPPIGKRGVGPGRAAAYGYKITDYLATANDRLLLAIQVESAEALANIDEIAAVDGVDVIFIGPFDLSVSMGIMGPAGMPKLRDAIAKIARVSLANGKTVGLFRPNGDDVADWEALGITFFLVGSDTMVLGSSAAKIFADIRGDGKRS